MDEVIYARLNHASITDIVGDRINPASPPHNSGLSTLYYAGLNVESVKNLGGTDSLAKYQYAIDVFGIDQTEVVAILDAVQARLIPWREGTVQACFLSNRVQVPEEEHFHGQVVVDVWAGS